MLSENVKQHWAEIRAIENELQANGDVGPDGEVFIVSRKNRKMGITPGRVSVVRLDQASLHIASQTHEVATPEQVADWRADQKVKGEAQKAQYLREKGEQKAQDMTPFAEALAKAIAPLALVAQQQAAQQQPHPAPAAVPPVPPNRSSKHTPAADPAA